MEHASSGKVFDLEVLGHESVAHRNLPMKFNCRLSVHVIFLPLKMPRSFLPESVFHPWADEMQTHLASGGKDSCHTLLVETRSVACEKEWAF